MMSITQFRPIEGFEGLYEIDNDGNVKSLKRNIIMKNTLFSNGYYHVSLSKEGKHYNKWVHRLVAEAFLPNQNNFPIINHKDENPKNNHIELTLDSEGNVVVDYEKSNLEWCTQKYNVNYGTRNQRIGLKLKGVPKPYMIEQNKRLKSKSVVAVDIDDNVIYEFASIKEAGRNGFSQSAVSACCRNCYYGSNYYKGYRWFYKSDWEEMQKEKAKPVKRELPYQLSLQFD